MLNLPEIDNINKNFQKTDSLKKTNFKIKSQIGQGSFSKVYKVVSLTTKKNYALKKITKRKIENNDLLDQLQNEIIILSNCNHENIIKIYGVFEDKEYVYLILELAEKNNLYKKLKKKKKFNNQTTKKFTYQILKALNHLHKKKPPILHRDLKPENILILKKKLKLADFGWSNLKKSIISRNTYCGTPDYLSPEMILGTGHDEKNDIWGLGVMMYEFLHGKPPFSVDRKIGARKGKKKMEDNILNLNITFGGGVCREAREVVLKMLQVKAEERLDAGELMGLDYFRDCREAEGLKENHGIGIKKVVKKEFGKDYGIGEGEIIKDGFEGNIKKDYKNVENLENNNDKINDVKNIENFIPQDHSKINNSKDFLDKTNYENKQVKDSINVNKSTLAYEIEENSDLDVVDSSLIFTRNIGNDFDSEILYKKNEKKNFENSKIHESFIINEDSNLANTLYLKIEELENQILDKEQIIDKLNFEILDYKVNQSSLEIKLKDKIFKIGKLENFNLTNKNTNNNLNYENNQFLKKNLEFEKLVQNLQIKIKELEKKLVDNNNETDNNSKKIKDKNIISFLEKKINEDKNIIDKLKNNNFESEKIIGKKNLKINTLEKKLKDFLDIKNNKKDNENNEKYKKENENFEKIISFFFEKLRNLEDYVSKFYKKYFEDEVKSKNKEISFSPVLKMLSELFKNYDNFGKKTKKEEKNNNLYNILLSKHNIDNYNTKNTINIQSKKINNIYLETNINNSGKKIIKNSFTEKNINKNIIKNNFPGNEINNLKNSKNNNNYFVKTEKNKEFFNLKEEKKNQNYFNLEVEKVHEKLLKNPNLNQNKNYNKKNTFSNVNNITLLPSNQSYQRTYTPIKSNNYHYNPKSKSNDKYIFGNFHSKNESVNYFENPRLINTNVIMKTYSRDLLSKYSKK